MATRVAIKDICKVYDGPHATPQKTEDGPVYLGIDAITDDGQIDPNQFSHLSEKDYIKWTKRVTPQYGDIVFSYEATLGRYALIPKDFYGCLGRRLAVIRNTSPNIDATWLYYYFRSAEWTNFIQSKIVKGSTVNRISIEDFPHYTIPCVPIETQKKIVDVLGRIDRKIQINDAVNDNLEQQAKLLYDFWFTQFDFPDEKGKPYRASGGQMQWNDTLKRYVPIGWRVVPLLKVANWESNSQPPKSEFIYKPREGYVRFIQNRDYGSSAHKTYIPMTKSLSIVDRYDILMDKYGDAGAVRYGIEGAFNVALGKINVHDKNHREYVRSFLASDGIYNYLHNSCMASTRASLNESNLAMLNIVIPDDSIVAKYEELLREIRDSILKTNDETAKLIELRDWLLPILMNGQASVED
mgnify:CR=1 FL=1